MTRASNDMFERIKRNIRNHGFHLYIVTEGMCPRFAYSIGLRESLGAELVLAGAIYYNADEVSRIFHAIRTLLSEAKDFGSPLAVDGLGSFTLVRSDSSWTKALLIGAFDFFKADEVAAYQIVPDGDHWTMDVPNLATKWSPNGDPAWQWLAEPWTYLVPPSSHAITNLAALRGSRITSAVRWEEDYWEIFAGDGEDVPREETRVVPLGCLLAADPSLSPVMDLEIGSGLRRGHEGGDWNRWGST